MVIGVGFTHLKERFSVVLNHLLMSTNTLGSTSSNPEDYEIMTERNGDDIYGEKALDAIDALPFVSLGAKAPNAPYFTEFYDNPSSFVYMNVEVTERFSSAPHIYESGTGLLITSVSVDGGAELISLNLSAVASELGFVVEANLESIIPRQAAFDGMASYDSATQLLTIPSLEVNLSGSVSKIRDVVFRLIDSQSSRFLLESYDQ